ncbi:HMG domain-containing protein 3 isoform X2 [Hyperolius riggenbachi]
MDDPFDGNEVTVESEEMEGTYVPAKPPLKKKKYRGCTDHGEAVRKPRSAYLLYYYDIYLSVQQKVPHLPQSEINKRISESWKLLSVAEKSYYLERAKLEKEGLDSNIKCNSATMVSDVPGFRRILPRSEYILIPKPHPEEQRPHQERLIQPRDSAAVAPSATSSHNGRQNVITVESGQIGLSEQLIDVDGLPDEGESVSLANELHEVLPAGVYSHCSRQVDDKVAGEIIVDDATLEIEETSTYPVIEEDGGISVARSVTSGMSVVTVMAIQDTEENTPAPATSQFIMLPMPGHLFSEPTRPVKLATTYTRRGRGSCTNPVCNFTYVTRHKPPICPRCNQYLGGKWIPKGKEIRQILPATLNATVRPSGSTAAVDRPVVSARESKVTEKENSEAVSQLLQSSQGEEWEEVVISEEHFNTDNESSSAPPEKHQEKTTKSAEDVHKTDTPPPTGGTKTTSQISTCKTTSPSSCLKSAESKCFSRPLAAARPIRAILPAPAASGRSINLECSGSTLTFIKPGAFSPLTSACLKASTLKQLGQAFLQQPIKQQLGKALMQQPIKQQIGKALVQHPIKEQLGKAFVQQPIKQQLGQALVQQPIKQQLGQAFVQQPTKQEIPVRADIPAAAQRQPDKGVTENSPAYKYSSPVPLDLGLATQRGRGRCKNPFCNFMYTNRHKPKVCPNCGSNLKEKAEKVQKPSAAAIAASTDAAVREPLSQSQKEVQRHSTLQLLRKTVQIPENECEMTDTFTLIQELNSSRLVLSDVSDGTVTIQQTSWASFYESPAEQCLLCGTQLYKGDRNPLTGVQDCWLLTANRLQLVSAQAKVCRNPHCLAIHSFNDTYTGLFNVGNKLLVSLDLLFSIRNQIKLGDDPRVSISNILESVQGQAEKMLSPEELPAVQDLLSCGYWAFECLTIRDYNDMICGVCGVAPKVEIAQRNAENTLTLTSIEFTWPELLTTNEVSVEDFWSTLETEVLEQAAFPSSIPIAKLDASIISPFFPPLMRGSVVVNSESYKNLEIEKVVGNGSALARLLHDGTLKLDDLNQLNTEELQRMLTLCGIPWNAADTKDNMCYSILALSEFVQNGTRVKQPPPHVTGGKVYKICPHQVVCGSKYIVRAESPRDHVDLLASSRHWPPVYVVDMATQVALCADLCYPNLTQQMWGKYQGCFSDPTESPQYVSCPELLDRHYNVDMMSNEPSIEHPITKSASRRIVHAVAEQNGASDPTSRHHSLSLCREMEPYSAIITAIDDSNTSNIRHHAINFDNVTHYYLYNRLIDFLSSREIVNRQIHDIVQSCQPGEVVIRDTLYRLGVAQIKTEIGDNDLEEDIMVEQTSSA